MRKLKVAHVLNAVGGVDVYLRLLLNNINDDEFESIVIHSINDAKEPFRDKSGRLIEDYKIPIFREISIIKDLSSVIKTYKLLKKIKPDVVHAHSAKGGIVGRLAGIMAGIRVLYTPHAFSYLSASNTVKNKAFFNIERFFTRTNTAVLATSQSEVERAVNEVGFKKEKVLLFSNSVEPVNNLAPLSIKQTWPDNYICTVGRPSYQKNTLLLIRVIHEIKKHVPIHLVIMGVGHYCEDLQKVQDLIQKLDLTENITLLEWTSRSDVFSIISKSKLYISTSRYEGLPYSVIETLSLGKPCVVSNCDGNKDLVQNNYNGYVIDNEDVENYKDKVILLLRDNDLRAQMGVNAKQLFNKNYNIHNTITLLEETYRKFK
ncbi:capsular polysaccharide biosynthesis protein [Flavobacterium suaedae]|uniref:Capsular polysaccharide biosynthesis protein n=1 Tax=Flavobacterium suaedae TaxID=1767027 RepID=A0ABQ1JTL0_9FLAO|nr:glycosyltransferase [Flavobacterium suaedae]GGB77504.1 capsular polysaccharide biosynthesis protein [Flavobacterium suaedae]